MSPVQFVLAALGTAPVRSLTLQAGKSLMAALLDDRPTDRSERRYCACRPARRASGERQVKQVVPGCVRVTVPGLWGDPEWAGALEARLLQVSGVRDVQASSRTGRVLMLFDPAVVTYAELDRLLAHDPVEALMADDAVGGHADAEVISMPVALGQGENVIDLPVHATR